MHIAIGQKVNVVDKERRRVGYPEIVSTKRHFEEPGKKDKEVRGTRSEPEAIEGPGGDAIRGVISESLRLRIEKRKGTSATSLNQADGEPALEVGEIRQAARVDKDKNFQTDRALETGWVFSGVLVHSLGCGARSLILWLRSSENDTPNNDKGGVGRYRPDGLPGSTPKGSNSPPPLGTIPGTGSGGTGSGGTGTGIRPGPQQVNPADAPDPWGGTFDVIDNETARATGPPIAGRSPLFPVSHDSGSSVGYAALSDVPTRFRVTNKAFLVVGVVFFDHPSPRVCVRAARVSFQGALAKGAAGMNEVDVSKVNITYLEGLSLEDLVEPKEGVKEFEAHARSPQETK